MKEKYAKPYAEIEEFKTVGIITTSAGGDNDPDTDIEVPWN